MRASALFLLLALTISLSAQGEPTRLRLAHFLPTSDPIHFQVIVPWCEDLQWKSRGELICEILPAMQSGGKPSDLVDQVLRGDVDIVWTVPGYSPGRFPVMEAMELPFVITDATSGSRASWEFYRQFGQSEFADFKVLAIHMDGGMVLHTATREVTKPADIRGLKIRVSGNIGAQTLTRLGAVPVSMPVSQINDALAQGTLDGALATWEVVATTKLHESTKFHIEPEKGSPFPAATVLSMLMNKQRYEALPANLRTVMDEISGPALVDRFGSMFDHYSAASRGLVFSQRGTILEFAKKDIEQMWYEAGSVEQAWIAQMTDLGLDGRTLAEQARALGLRNAR